MNPPCHNCKSRTATCHATCTAHALWKMEDERQKKELNVRKHTNHKQTACYTKENASAKE